MTAIPGLAAASGEWLACGKKVMQSADIDLSVF